MSEISLLVLIEAGQVRSWVGLAFQLPLPELLIWGSSVLPRVETTFEATDDWPQDSQLISAAIIDRDARRIVRAGASHTFDTPYQLVLFERMVTTAWPGYSIEQTELTCEALAAAAQIDPPPVDPNLSKQIVGAAIGDELDEHDDDDFDEDDEGEGDDFRQLTTSRAEHDPESMIREFEDQDWFVSVRTDPNEPYLHYHGDFVMQTFIDGGPGVVEQLSQLHASDVPKERSSTRGIVVDADQRKMSIWAHPRGLSWWRELEQNWPDWQIEHWLTNGYRRHLETTNEADRMVVPSDLQALTGFIPSLTEQLDVNEVLGQIKSSVRGFVRKGFGCLAFVLAVPALIAWAVSGSWKGPFAFAGTIWVMALIAYLVIANKMKRNFAGLGEQRKRAVEMMPKLAPDDRNERVKIVDAALQAAGLPSHQQVEAFAEQYDEDDDEDNEPIEPIVSG